MFFLYATLAAFFYALNNVLLAPIARRSDPLLVCSYRGLALGLTMIPVIFFMTAPEHYFQITPRLALLMIFTSAVTVGGNFAYNASLKYLPVAISSSICLAFSTVVAMMIGFLFFREKMSEAQLVLVICILIETAIMGIVSRKNSFHELNIKKGVSYCLIFGLCLGTGYSLVAFLSKMLNPIVVGYFWELGAGIVGLCIYFLMQGVRQAFSTLDRKDFFAVLKASSPTVAGTSLYAISTTMGSIGILAAIISTSAAISALLSHVILKEKLKPKEWFIVLTMIGTLVVLKLIGT